MPDNQTSLTEEELQAIEKRIRISCMDALDRACGQALKATAIDDRSEASAQWRERYNQCCKALSDDLPALLSELRATQRERDAETAKRRELSGIVTHWQKFVAEMGKLLHCMGTDEDVKAKTKQLIEQLDAARKMADGLATNLDTIMREFVRRCDHMQYPEPNEAEEALAAYAAWKEKL